ncbi:hypothetical protein P7C73_g5346, partial [Tremellales sp. Uapishka_1]
MGSDKGKEVQVVDDDSDGDDLDFFTAKPRKYTKPLSPIRITPEKVDYESEDEDDEGDGEGKKKRKKRPRPPQKKFKPLPEWTRELSSKRSVDRGSTEERKRRDTTARSDVIEIISSSDEIEIGKGKGKAVAQPAKKRRIVLTPPPELDEARIAQIQRDVEKFMASDPGNPLTDAAEDLYPSSDPIPIRSSSPSAARVDRATVTVKMVMDPTRLPPGASQRAVKEYEKIRNYTVNRREPLEFMVKALCHSINKTPDDIVLIHNGQKLFSFRMTPIKLGIVDVADMVGYEKTFYERLEQEKKQARAARLAALKSPSPSPDPGSRSRNGSPNLTPTTAVVKVKLTLKDNHGREAKVRLSHGTTAGAMLKWFCKKTGRSMDDAETLALVIEGEAVDRNTKIEDMDVDEGDQIDVEER